MTIAYSEQWSRIEKKAKHRYIELSTQFSQFSSRCVNIYVHTNKEKLESIWSSRGWHRRRETAADATSVVYFLLLLLSFVCVYTIIISTPHLICNSCERARASTRGNGEMGRLGIEDKIEFEKNKGR